MRTIINYIAIIATVATLMGCGKTREHGKEAGKCNNAALKLYCQYADNENLTVAYLGDFEINGNPIDAVMLQAHDDEEWLTLRQSFDIDPSQYDSGAETPCIDSNKIISVGVGIESDFLEKIGIDSLTDRSQVTEEHIGKCTQEVAAQINDILSNFQEADSTMPENAFHVGDGPVLYDHTDMSYDDYIDTIAKGVALNILEEYFAQLDSINALNGDLAQKENELSNDAHSGYVTAADHSNRTLWLFFYNDLKELNNILTHIREDIITNYETH